ncbi:hypothetical protein ACPPVU_10375 [Mucilaginibacter sp. McL0603]|uniref:hypothetical protein n=1 Tax=Mucilaginibacter sp. McL0603 TaxID=3415670 RepID=UPI003CF46859
MRSFLFNSFLLILLPVCSFGQGNLETRKLFDGKVELMVPAEFKPMTVEVMDQKYPNSGQQPDVVLTDDNAEVNIVASRTKQLLQASQMEAYKDFMIASLKKSHPDAQWLDSGVKTINGKRVGYFKMLSNAADQKVFVYYFFTDMDGRALIMTFNCTEKLLPAWKETADNIVSSLKVK